MLQVARTGSSTFEGHCLRGAVRRVFGGQLLAQALYAAGMEVGAERSPHSLHAYFLRQGSPQDPVEYTVIALHLGRSVSTVQVNAVQSGELLLTTLVSFHRSEETPDVQTTMPRVVEPEQLSATPYIPPGSNPDVRAPLDIRYPDAPSLSDEPAAGAQRVWLRARDRLPDQAVVHAAALVFASDLTITRTAHLPLRAFSTRRLGASLDHAMWFHRPLRADDWLLFDQRSDTYAGARALSYGQLYDRTGRLVASATQEALIRMQRPEIEEPTPEWPAAPR